MTSLPFELRQRIFENTDYAGLLARIDHQGHIVHQFDAAALPVLRDKLQHDLSPWPPFLANDTASEESRLLNLASTTRYWACANALSHLEDDGRFVEAFSISPNGAEVVRGNAMALLGQMKAGESQVFSRQWRRDLMTTRGEAEIAQLDPFNWATINQLAVLSVTEQGVATCDVFDAKDQWFFANEISINLVKKLAKMHRSMFAQ